MNKKLRVFSLLMVLVLMISMIPMAAMAADKTASKTVSKTTTKTTSSSKSGSTTRYVKTSNGLSLNIRSSRKTHSDNIIGHIPYGEKVTVLRDYSSWAYVKYGNIKGYVVKSALSSSKPKSSTVGVKKVTYNPDGSYVNIRSTMKSHTNNIVVSLRTGTTVTVLDTYAGGWSKVVYGGYTGYVQSRYLRSK